MIVSPDLFEIKNSLLEDIDQKFFEGITRDDYLGLDLVPFLIMPHIQNPEYQSDIKKTIEKLPAYPYPLIFLHDGQAVWVEGSKFEIVQ
jgi:peptidase E